MTAPQDDARTTGSTPVLPSPPEEPANLPAGAPSFSPRWGRIGVALVGLVALLTALVTLVPAAFGAVSLLLPAVSLAVAVAAVAVLRMLAVRARRARIDQAFLHAMAPVHEAEPAGLPAPLPAAAPRRPTSLFDAEETATRRLMPMELRTAALAVVHGSTAVDVRDASAQGAGAAAVAGTDDAPERTAPEWAPVDVPRPTYVDAAKAERQAPAPLDLPEAPKPTSRTPIKASEAAARIAATDDTAHDATDAAPATGRINLDDVLQRRRA